MGDKKLPIFFTGSNSLDVEYALHESKFAKAKDVRIVGVEHMRFHADKPKGGYTFSKETAHELYPAFLDLYMLGYSACVTKTRLGFGILGSYIAGETCLVDAYRNCSTRRIPA